MAGKFAGHQLLQTANYPAEANGLILKPYLRLSNKSLKPDLESGAVVGVDEVDE